MRCLLRILFWCFLGAVLYLSSPWLLEKAAGRLIVSDDDGGPADAELVLSGDRGARASTAIQRFLKGNIGTLVLYSGEEILLGSQKRKGEYAREEALKQGVPASRILLPEMVHSTYQEAQTARRLAQEKGWKKLLVVTNAFHSRRARWIFYKVFQDSGCQIRILHSSLAAENLALDRWWTREDELLWVFTETVKSALYFIKYRKLNPPPAPA